MTTATHMRVINYTLDDEPQETTAEELTPRQIMENAKPKAIDPNTHYLVLIEGHHQVSYEGKPDDPIHMHEHMQFVSISQGPTPVS